MMHRSFQCVLASFSLLLTLVFPLSSGARAEEPDPAEYRYYYAFTDRHGKAAAALEEAFASRVVSFTPGDPWTEYETNQNPGEALGLPNAAHDVGDLTLGAGGELVVELGLPVYDGPGADLFIFETGDSVEEMLVSVSDDLATWYEAGSVSGSTAELDLEGSVPEGMSFRYVKLLDSGNSTGGNWPGADVDALCALHARTNDSIPNVYRFQNRHGTYFAALESAFAVRTVSFTPGNPWTDREENQDTAAALGLPDAGDGPGELNLGAGGVLVVELGVPVRDGPGYDLFVFESGSGSVEKMLVEVSDDLASWYDVGTLEGSVAEADLAGKTPEGASFRYVRLTDAGESTGGSWPGGDIDAVCSLCMEGGYSHFADKDGVIYSAPAKAFASRVVDFIPGYPWTSRPNDRKVENALGAPDYDGSDGELTLGGSGVVTLAFDVELFDGPGLDVFVFEIADDVESTRIEVSRDLETWYEVGISEGDFAGVDIGGKIPEGYGFSYVRLTDLRDHPDGTWPGADIDAVCGLHTREKAGPGFPYRINSILVQNDTFRISKEEMTVHVSVTKTAQLEAAKVVLAAYGESGRLVSAEFSEPGGEAAGETFNAVFTVDNRDGKVAELRAFIFSPDLVPVSYTFAYAETDEGLS